MLKIGSCYQMNVLYINLEEYKPTNEALKINSNCDHGHLIYIYIYWIPVAVIR